jgi:hypothetical protein
MVVQELQDGKQIFDRSSLAAVVIALALGAIGGWLRTPYASLFLFFALMVLLVMAGVSLVRAFRGCLRTNHRGLRRWAPFALTLLFQPIVFVALMGSVRLSDSWTTSLRFTQKQEQYGCIVSHVSERRWPKGDHGVTACGTHAVVRVADRQVIELESTGYFSNWEVIAYDPTGSLGLIESLSVNRGPSSSRDTFGAFKVTACRRLSGNYFFCQLD